MIVNGRNLLAAQPLSPMLHTKERGFGVSFGLAEAGYDIRLKQCVTLHPFRRFALASAIEHFDVPNDLVGIVHDKSTHARRGLSVFNTVVEPGWSGFLTLELVYHGWGILHLPAGIGIAQVLFHRTETPASYSGKYQDQEDRPVAAIMEK